ncbi:MAG TPA: NTP transferase domain-containing protein [Streptosporangiaceae bacterium]|nr:NTP transferase domain-containing protein [Streptosporangiaceae bacterium]
MSAARPAAVIVLAAGEGSRMRSAIPKALHEVCGQTMLGHCLASAAELRPERLIVVVGHHAERVSAHALKQAPGATIVTQDYLGGTGHAVRIVLETVGTIDGTVLVTYADTPLLKGATLARLVRERDDSAAAAAVLTARAPDPTGYGRIIRDGDGLFSRIVEQTDATAEQRAITEINSGMYAFDGGLLADAVKRVRADNAQGEEYLTDAVCVIRADGHQVATVHCQDFEEVQGVNDLAQLAHVSRVMNARILESAMRAGVRIADPESTWVDVSVELAVGAHIGPGTQLEGSTTIAQGASVGPGCLLRDTRVGAGATVIQSVCESAVIGDGARVGPFAHLVGSVIASPCDMSQHEAVDVGAAADVRHGHKANAGRPAHRK